MVSIYRLLDPITFEVRYIGQTTKSLERRLGVHLSCNNRSYITCWVKSLKSRGLRPLIEEIVSVDTNEEADYIEILLISFFRSVGYRLTNLHGGGRSGQGVSEETRERMAAAKRGKKLSPEHVAKIGNANRGRPKPSGFGAKVSAAQKGRSVSPEERQRLSTIRLGTTISEEHKRKIVDANKKVWEVTSPGGQPTTVSNLNQFCRENGLNSGVMSCVASGKYKQHKGWKVRRERDNDEQIRTTTKNYR